MSTFGYRELRSEIKKGRLGKAYLLSGRDRGHKDEAINDIGSALRRMNNNSLAVVRIHVDETPPEELSSQLLNLPLFERFKLVIIRRIESADKKCRDVILDFVQSPPDGICLVTTTDLAKQEYTRKGPAFLRDLAKRVTPVDFSPPREKELRERAWDLAGDLGFGIEREALDRLLTMTGGDFEAVRREMVKLSLFLQEGGEAGVEEVDTVISRGREVDVWGLVNAIGGRDISGAQRILHGLIESGERPVQIVGALWYQMTRMAWCRELLDEGVGNREIGRRLKIGNWMLRGFIARSGGFSREEYSAILGRLFEIDLAVRSGGRDIESAFSRNVAEMLCGAVESGMQ